MILGATDAYRMPCFFIRRRHSGIFLLLVVFFIFSQEGKLMVERLHFNLQNMDRMQKECEFMPITFSIALFLFILLPLVY